MRACQIQSAGACWLRASLRTAPSSRLSCGALALTCLGITLLLPLRNTPTSYCSPFEERSTRNMLENVHHQIFSSFSTEQARFSTQLITSLFWNGYFK